MADLDRAGRSALHYAALNGGMDQVNALLDEGFDPGLADRQGMTPLHFAAQEYAVDAARILLDAGAAVDVQDRAGRSPLYLASFNSKGRGELIGLLRDHGADPRLANSSGKSPLDVARLIGNYDVRQFYADIEDA